MQPEAIFRSGVQHTIYVTTESGEVGVILERLGYSRDPDNRHAFYLGSNKSHAMTASVTDLGLSEALLKQEEIGFHPQCRLILNCNGDRRSYEKNALKLAEEFARQEQWYAVCGLGKPYVHADLPAREVEEVDFFDFRRRG